MERNWNACGKRKRGAFYDRIRSEWNDADARSRWKTYKKAAYFLFLNKTCWNGLWRVNALGEFNVPMGDVKEDHVICDAAALREASRVLSSTTIRIGNYWITSSAARDGDLVYFDPPYDPVSASSSFTAYTGAKFDQFSQIELADRALFLVQQGAYVMLSNSNTPFIRKLYRERGFTLHRVAAKRSINSDGTKRGKVSELIITGGY